MQECKETSVGILDSLLSNVEDQDLLSHEDAQMFYKRHYIEMCLGCCWDCDCLIAYVPVVDVDGVAITVVDDNVVTCLCNCKHNHHTYGERG
mgnify:CR=1 FL=1